MRFFEKRDAVVDTNFDEYDIATIHLTPLQVSSARRRNKKYPPLNDIELQQGCRLGTDSHAEVSCYGRHARITAIHEGMSVNVSPFHDSYAPLTNVNFADACFAFDAPNGQVYILHHHYGLDFTSSMEDSILCTNQSRAAGIIVDDVPPCFDARGETTHSVYFPDKDIRLPLSLHNAVSYLPVRYPTDEDMMVGIDVDLSDDIPWDPTMFGNNTSKSIAKIINDINYDDDDYEWNDNMHPSLVQLWNDQLNVSAVSHNLRPDIDAEKLADLWHISIEMLQELLSVLTWIEYAN